MRVTVLNQEEKKGSPIFRSIVLLLLGIILLIHSNELLTLCFTLLGLIVLLYGISKLVRYYQLKKSLKIDQSEILISAIVWIILGFLVIFLSNFFVNAIQIVTGIWILFLAISKYRSATFFKENKKKYGIECVSSLILLLLGIYTIFAQNVVFIFLGIVLIFYSLADIYQSIQKK